MSDSTSVKKLGGPMVAAICASLEDTFSQMVFMPVTVGAASDKSEGAPTGHISGTVGLSGTQDGLELRAKLSLIFPEAIAKRVFRSMMMMELDTPVEMSELRDVVGELANMTAGGAKTRLSEDGFKLLLSLPNVAIGADHYLGDPSGIAFSKVVPVSLDSDSVFHVEVSVS